MDEKVVHDLAVAYAQVCLFQELREHPEETGYTDTIQLFLKSYHFARIHIPKENVDIDLSTLV